MSASDELEDAIQRQINAESKRTARVQAQHAQQLAESARLAAGFIDLMRKHGVEPEPVYTWRQVRHRRPKKSFEEFQRIDSGWVIDYSVSEFDQLFLITYLRPDGKVVGCDARQPGSSGLTVRGLIAPFRCRAFSAVKDDWVLYIQTLGDKAPEPQPLDPYFKAEDYVKAARRYLT